MTYLNSRPLSRRAVVTFERRSATGRASTASPRRRTSFERCPDLAERLNYEGGKAARSEVAISPSNPNRMYWLVGATIDARGHSQIGILSFRRRRHGLPPFPTTCAS